MYGFVLKPDPPPEWTPEILSERLFAEYSGLADKPARATSEWNVLWHYQRDAWLQVAKFVLETFKNNPPKEEVITWA